MWYGLGSIAPPPLIPKAPPAGCDGCLYLHGTQFASWRCTCPCHVETVLALEAKKRKEEEND